MKKKLLFIPLLFVLILAVGYIFLCSQVLPFSNAENSETVKIEIQYGESTLSIINKLKENSLIKNEKICYILARKPAFMNFLIPLKGSDTNFSLKSGTYYLSPNMNIAQIFAELSSGKQEYQKVSIPEGLTISAIAKILEENRICSASDFIKSCSSETILQKYNIPGTTCEGYLFPDTYYLNVNMESDFIVEHFIENFIKNLKSIPNYTEKTPEELFEIVTLASIVEKEYKVKEEAPLIASVFKNRIRHNIGLYSCATIVYIITEIQGKPHPNRILTKDTKIDNPYNTYKWAGLTPGPISNPGLTALDAVINTPKTPYFFFQVKDEKKGTHVFTETFEEHKTNH